MKICVYAIAKNEAEFVTRFCRSAKDADLILIVDTGSTDQTIDTVLSIAATTEVGHDIAVPSIHISPWRFDHARNAALAMVPADMDVCISLDLDEELQPGWREEIERVWKVGETTRLGYMFDWGLGIQFRYEKIHARAGYRWHHPCHEYPTPDSRIREIWAETDKLLVIHKPDSTKSRGSYLELLALSVTEDPHCPRNAFYYARELSFHGQFEAAIAQCDRYLALPRATWQNERCYAHRVRGRCYTELGDLVRAEMAFLMAAQEAPNTREPWCELAVLMYRQARWPECYASAIRCLSVVDRALVYTVDPEVWGSKPHDFAAISAFRLGLYAEAVKHGQISVQMSPDDPRLKVNLGFYMGQLQC